MTVAPMIPTASKQRLRRAAEARHDRVPADLAQVGVREDQLGDVADADHADDRGDHRLEQPHAEPLKPEDRERRDAGEDRRGKEAEAEEQLEPDRGAQELREVGRHRDQLGLYPQAARHSPRIPLAADLGQVVACRDAELRRERLDHHRHQARGDDHPDQRVAELRSGGDVRREVARVDVRDAGDERRAEEGQDAEARPVERLVDGLEPLGQDVGAGGDHPPILAMPKTRRE